MKPIQSPIRQWTQSSLITVQNNKTSNSAKLKIRQVSKLIPRNESNETKVGQIEQNICLNMVLIAFILFILVFIVS